MPQDMKKAQLFSGKKICFENEEVTEMKKFDEPGPCRLFDFSQCDLHLLAFEPVFGLLPEKIDFHLDDQQGMSP